MAETGALVVTARSEIPAVRVVSAAWASPTAVSRSAVLAASAVAEVSAQLAVPGVRVVWRQAPCRLCSARAEEVTVVSAAPAQQALREATGATAETEAQPDWSVTAVPAARQEPAAPVGGEHRAVPAALEAQAAPATSMSSVAGAGPAVLAAQAAPADKAAHPALPAVAAPAGSAAVPPVQPERPQQPGLPGPQVLPA
jgi:hypothetical protein